MGVGLGSDVDDGVVPAPPPESITSQPVIGSIVLMYDEKDFRLFGKYEWVVNAASVLWIVGTFGYFIWHIYS
jgi:hypothetical protein